LDKIEDNEVIPEILLSTENSRQAVLDTVLLGFSSDPFIRWLCPEAHNYLLISEAFNAFGGNAINNQAAYITKNYEGAALWLPPGIEPNEEAFVAEIEKMLIPRAMKSCLKFLKPLKNINQRRISGICL
jgi:hypothetical protein